MTAGSTESDRRGGSRSNKADARTTDTGPIGRRRSRRQPVTLDAMTLPPIVPGHAEPQHPPTTPAPQPPRRSRAVLPWTVAAIALAVVAGLAAWMFLVPLLTASSGDELRTATKACNAGQLADGDTTLLVDLRITGGRTATVDDLACILNHLDAPAYVPAQMGSTKAVDGRQTATWGDFEASWSFSPSSGLNVIIRDVG